MKLELEHSSCCELTVLRLTTKNGVMGHDSFPGLLRFLL